MTDLERLEQELQAIRLTPSKSTDARMLAAASQALSRPRQVTWSLTAFLFRSWRRRLAVAAAVTGVLFVLLFWSGLQIGQVSAAEVLARTAKALQSVTAYHYEMRTFGEGSGPVREIWAEGERIYARGLREGKLVSEFWADPTRIVRYDRENKKVTISDAEPRLLRAFAGIALVRNFKPEDWQALPEGRVRQDGRWYRVFELPETGTFQGLGRSGETKMRLWVDEKTNLPARLESQLRPPETEQWERFQEVEFLWDEKEIPEDLFVPSYPVTAQVSDERRLPGAEVREALPPVAPEVMTEPIVTLQDGVALEKLWIHPAGLVIMRLDLDSRQPFGLPPQLDSPDKNPWGLRPEEIPLATKGLLSFDEPTLVSQLGVGAVSRGRWAVYLLYEFEPRADGTLAKTLTFRYLLARSRRPSDESSQIYIDTVLKDPSAWHLYEFTVVTKDYINQRIPEEVYGSPNLDAERVLPPALRKVLQRYESAGNSAKVQEFIRSQGPRTQRLLERISDERRLPGAEVGEALPPVAPEVMTKPIVTLQDGVALEKLWIHPAGLVVMRLDLGDRQPFGAPPQLKEPEKNPWGLKAEEIPLALNGELSFKEGVAARWLGNGAVGGRRAGYLVYEFEAQGDGVVPETLRFRYLLARRRLPSDASFDAYGDAVLKDPSSWHLYEFTVPTKEYVTDRIPEEVYASPNLEAERVLTPALRKVLKRYEAAGNSAKVQEFIHSQGPRTQRLLENIREGR